MPAPNLETARVFGIVAISMQPVVIPFLKVPFFYKNTCPRHGFAGPEVLAPFHSLLGSTSWYLPALAYASDRHVTDVNRCYVPSVLCYVCSVSVIKAVYPNIHRGISIIIEININPDDISNNNLILPIFCRALIYYWIIIIYYWIIIIYYHIIIIHYRIIITLL